LNEQTVLFNGVAALFTISIFLISLFWHRRRILKEKLRVTKDLVTPAAFTGKFEISEELWRQVEEKYFEDQREPSAQLFLLKSFERLYEL